MGFVTEITYPDETTETFVYQNDFHALTDATDERGTVTHYEYDEDGHVIAITDAFGTADAVTTNYVWEGGLLVEVRDDGDNLLFEYEYDAYNRKISELDGEANEQTWTYDVNGNVATWIDGRGITTSYTNDAKGRVLSVTIDSVTQKFEYDDAGSLTRMIDADGTYFDTEYDSRGNAVRSIAGSNTSTPIITSSVFDDADQLIGAYDSNGNYTSFAYDAVGRLTNTTDALGNRDRIAYNAAGEMIGYRDVLGNWTRYKLDDVGQVEVITDALGNETTFTRDEGGLVTSVEDALGKETLYSYNARGQIETSEDADGVAFAYAYDDNGLLLSITDDLGRVTTYGRDALGNVTSVTEADGTASERLFSFTLDENGNAIETTDALSRDTTYEYDDFDRLIETTDAAGNVWEWTYADNGNVLTETYNGKTTAYTYDALGRLVLTTDADDRETHFEYGNDGRLMRVIDGEENATEYLYDALGRLVLTIAADGGKTEQRYDAASNLVALIDPVGNTTTWLYDRRYQVVSETDPLGQASFAIYDEVGRAASTTDRLGRTKVYTWSDAGRLLTEEWYDSESTLVETLTYTYYEDGRLWTATNSAGTYTYTYDDLGRVATVVDPNGITLTYGWDEVDDLVTLTDSKGGEVASVYDEAHRLLERAQSGTGVESLSIQIDFDEEGRRGELRRYSDVTGTTLISSTVYGYDDAGNLTSLIHKDDAGDPLVTYVNTFDDNSRITSETRNSVTVNYEYDATSQVINDDTNEYEYDANGNRTMDGYSTGAGNRIETDGTWTYEYDLEGNLIKKSQGEEAETWTYGYDHNNRLLWVEKADTDGGIVRLRVEFTYDVFGNRIKQQVETFDEIGDPLDSETHRYAFIGQQVWADLDEAGDIVTRYLLGDATGERFARSGDGDTFWLLTDRLGSIREVLDETGEIVDEITYDAFGNFTETEPGFGGDYLFAGMLFDQATGLYVTWARYYNPTIAKWLQNDPIGFNGGLMNLYGYVGNKGTNATDLSGLQEGAIRFAYELASPRPTYTYVPYTRVAGFLDKRMQVPIRDPDQIPQSSWEISPGRFTDDIPPPRKGRFLDSTINPIVNTVKLFINEESNPHHKAWKARQITKDEYEHRVYCDLFDAGWTVGTSFAAGAKWGLGSKTPVKGPVPRQGPHGVDPAHHNANILVRDSASQLRHHERIVSGNMTPAEQALGFPRGSLASHSEARAIRNIPLQPGEIMIITGQNPPCNLCKGMMNQAASESGATIIYRWRENGVTRTWTASN